MAVMPAMVLAWTLLSAGCGEEPPRARKDPAAWARGVDFDAMGEVALVALSPGEEKRLRADDPSAFPYSLLRRWRPPAGPRPSFEIEGRTAFYVFFLDRTRRRLGEKVAFWWYYGDPPKAFATPTCQVIHAAPGLPCPVAWAAIWSDPGSGGRAMSFLGLDSVVSRDDWARSRSYGPRLVRLRAVTGDCAADRPPAPGREITQQGFDIMPQGVTVYR